MHASKNCRGVMTLLIPALLAGMTLSDQSLRASEAVGAANPSAGEITVIPRSSLLSGRRATQQLIATSRAADGLIQDATRSVQWLSRDPAIATVTAKGRVIPKGNGAARIIARLGSSEVEATIRVEGMDGPSPVSFRRDVIPAFSQAGCNMGACHGTPTGKGGFRLSLRGYLPDQDFAILSHESGGRRITPIAAETSLLLRKPLGEVPHEGGLRLIRSSKTYEFLHDWIQEGAKDDPGATAAVRLEILPESRVLIAPAATQQVVVFVHDAKQKVKDVTPICYYDSSNPEIAEVDAEGYVRFKSRGEVAIIAHYLNLVANIRLTHLVDVPGFAQSEVPQDNVIDRAVFAKLNRMRIKPSATCTDREFIRRVYLDVIGVLPTPDEVARFLDEPAKTRRDRAIDALLERPEFYDFWALKFADILRANGRLIESKGAYVFHRWIRTCLERDLPMDQFVRELADLGGLNLQESGGQLLSDQPRPRERRRDHGPALPGSPDSMRQVP